MYNQLFTLSLSVVIVTVHSKSFGCNVDLKDHKHFLECCALDDNGEENSYSMEWDSSISESKACKCAPMLQRDNWIDYKDLHFCKSRSIIKGKAWPTVMIIIWIPVILFLFTLIGSTADLFFVPTLEQLSKVMQLTPSVAGATLIALANGAPDFFCSIAGMSGNEQAGLIIGGTIGSAVLSLFIFGVVIVVAPYQSKKRLFLRDTLSLLFVVGLFGIAIHCKVISFWIGIVMFLIYGLYVLIVVFSKQIIQKMPPQIKKLFTRTNLFDAKFRKHSIVLHTAKKSIITAQMPIDSVSAVMKENDDEDIRDLDITSDEDMDEQSKEVSTENVVTMTSIKISNNPSTTTNNGEKSKKIPFEIEDEYESEEDKADLSITETPFFVYGHHLIAYFKHITEWNEQSYWGNFLYIVESPLIILRMISIPMIPDDESMYSREFITLSLICCPTLCIFSFFSSFLIPVSFLRHIPIYIVSLSFGLICYFCLLSKSNIPKNKFVIGFFLILSMIACSSWIMLFANELLALLDVISIVIGMSEEATGYTFLAIGNSVPDLMINVAAAKNGDYQAAITACFAGTIFNILCSFGVAICASGFGGMRVHGGLKYLFAFSFIVIGVLFIIIKSIACKYYLGKTTGIVLIGWYLLFLVFVIWGGIEAFWAPSFINQAFGN